MKRGLTREQINMLPTRIFKATATKQKPKASRRSKGRSAGSKSQPKISSATVDTETDSVSSTPLNPGGLTDQIDGKDSENSPVKSSEEKVPVKEEPKECLVCMNEYCNREKLRILPCFHEFHMRCIDKWIKVSSSNIQYQGNLEILNF